MIPLKQAAVPTVREGVLRIGPGDTEGRVTRRVLVGFMPAGESLVPAWQGTELPVRASLLGAKALYGAEEKLFAAMTGFYVVYPDDGAYSAAGSCNGAVSFWSEAGARTFYLIRDKGMSVYLGPDDFRDLGGIAGADCAAVHRERLFLGSGNTLRWSVPLEPADFSGETEKAGSIALSGTGGSLVSLVSAGDLYCFREHAILKLEADANDLGFRFTRVPFYGQTVEKGSVKNCGPFVAFLTERGLNLLAGGSCRLARTEFCGAVPTAPVQAAGCGGRYYLAAKTPSGKGCIYVYDPDGDFLLDEEADILGSTDEWVYFVHGTHLYRLTAPEEGKTRRIVYALDVGRAGGGPRYLSGVTLYGKGTFRVSVQTEEGSAEAVLRAGERCSFERRIRGEAVRLELSTAEKEARVDGIRMHVREDIR